jgi:hypothetical protein
MLLLDYFIFIFQHQICEVIYLSKVVNAVAPETIIKKQSILQTENTIKKQKNTIEFAKII